MKSLLFTAILSLRKRSEQILIKFAILLQVRLTHAQTFFRGVDNKLLEQLVTSLLSSTTLQHLVNKLLTKHPDDKLLEQHCYKSAVALSQLARFYTCVDASIHSSRADVIPIAKDKIT
jgi:hypothetical protein